MSKSKAHLMLLAVPFALSLGAAGYAAGLSGGDGATAAPACAVDAETANGALSLEALFLAGDATDGLYEFTVKSIGGANRTDIRQGGGFNARADESVVLGKLVLGRDAAYEVTLKVRAGGEIYECRQRFGQSA